MTVQPHTPALPALAAPAFDAPGVEAMRTWLELASAAQALVTPLVGSAFIPASYRTAGSDLEVQRANAVGAVLLGLSLGIDPLTALQQIYVVHGRPGMYTKLKVALVQRHGHEVWDEEYSADRATVCGRRAGWPEDRIVRVTVTMDDAKRAGWTTNAAYAKTPADMLWSRAAARVVDRIASDVLHGIASIEDITDDDTPAPAPTPVTSTVSVADLPPAPPRPARAEAPAVLVHDVIAKDREHQDETLPDKAPPESAAPETPNPARMIRKLGERWTALKVTGPGQTERRGVIVNYLVGRPVKAMSELTVDELQMLTETLTPELVARIEAEVSGEPEPAPEAEYDPTTEAAWTPSGVDEFAGGQR